MATVSHETCVPTAATPLLRFFDDYYAHSGSLRGRKTPETYRSDLRTLNRYFRDVLRADHDVTLGDLCCDLLRGCMVNMVATGRAAATANKLRSHVRAVWSAAIEMELITQTPNKVKKLKEPKRLPECWSEPEMSAILNAAKSRKGRIGKDVQASLWWYALILLIYNTGLRISAVMQIAIRDVDLDRGEVRVRAEVQKHNADQVFDLMPETVLALRAIRPERNATIFGDWPFDPPGTNWRTLTRHLRKILGDAGCPATRLDLFHKFRRTFATFLAAREGLPAAMHWLGHSSLAVTKRYIDWRFMGERKLSQMLPSIDPPQSHGVQLRLYSPADEAAG